MKKFSNIINTPEKETVIVEHKGLRYIATEEDIRYMQYLVITDGIDPSDYKVIDVDSGGNEYEMKFQMDSGVFENNFTSNIYRFNSEYALKVLGEKRKIRIIPYSNLDSMSSDDYYYMSNRFLHGKLQYDMGDGIGNDIFALPVAINTEGKHILFHGNKKCTLYQWNRFNRLIGLVVYNDDVESVKYAELCYKHKLEMV